MAYDEGLAQRIRDLLDERRDVTEKKMFGGIAFMVAGHMSVGIIKDDLMVRVGPEAHERLAREPHARDMDFTGKPMKGYLYVAPPGVASDAGLRRWVDRGVAFATSLPPKKKKK
jgi:TfoX/Sxy family transcriptional regulator of competence genes